MRIALWGFGRYGKRLYRAIKASWADSYQVVAVFDESFNGSTDEEGVLASEGVQTGIPDHVADWFHQGLFEGVVVAIARYDIASHVRDELARRDVPEVTLGSQSDFKEAGSFGNCTTLDDAPDPCGYAFRRYDGIFGVPSLMHGARPMVYLFDELGSIVRDTWFANDLDYDPYPLNYPMPFKHAAGTRIFLAGDYCVVGRVWGKNYWHFVFQHLDQVELMESRGFEGTYVLARAPFAADLLDLMGVEPHRVLWIDDMDANAVYVFEHAFVVARNRYSKHECAPVMVDVGKRITAHLGSGEGKAYPSKLYVKRIQSRRLLGCDDVIAQCGFEAVVPEELSVREQIRYFSNADIVLCPHGANSTNSLFMHSGAVFVETFSAGWVKPYCHEPLFLKGVHYLPVIDMPIYRNCPVGQFDDYSVNPRMLQATLESADCLVRAARR